LQESTFLKACGDRKTDTDSELYYTAKTKPECADRDGMAEKNMHILAWRCLWLATLSCSGFTGRGGHSPIKRIGYLQHMTYLVGYKEPERVAKAYLYPLRYCYWNLYAGEVGIDGIFQ